MERGKVIRDTKNPDRITIHTMLENSLVLDCSMYILELFSDNYIEMFTLWYREEIKDFEYHIDSQSKPVFLGRFNVFYKPVSVELMKSFSIKFDCILHDFSDEEERNKSDLTTRPTYLY